MFLDLGGTLVKLDETRELPLDSQGKLVIELLPGVAEKLRPMRDHLIFVVTNQSKVALGRFRLEQVEAAIAEVDRQLGGILSAWRICPHSDGDNCQCRKPKPGMVTELADFYGVDLTASTMVGDQEIDELTSRRAGVGNFVRAKDFFGWK